jgi:hypothetical protein
VASNKPNSGEICSNCGSPLSASLKHCPSCKADAGAPNVRNCRTEENLKALNDRLESSRLRADANSCLNEFNNLESLVKDRSGVVVSMPANMARKLVEDPRFIYENYEKLVGAGVRKPASIKNDRHRCAVGGLLFGNFANQIVYGMLSLTDEGLPTYGDIHCRLRSVTIEKRTSFLEVNSFKFVTDHRIVPGDKLPVGYTACWRQRHCIVLVKLADRLSTGQSESDWQTFLIQTDGQNRGNDDFIEAHIFEGFDINSIDSMTPVLGKKLRREEQLDAKLAISNFMRLRHKTK